MRYYDYDCGRALIGEQTIQDELVSGLLDEFEKNLKGRQCEVFHLLRQGATSPQIALILGMTANNVRRDKVRLIRNLQKRYTAIDLSNHSMADYFAGAC